MAWNTRKQWQEWTPPPVLFEGQKVRVHRWQQGGFWEEGVVSEVRVVLAGAKQAAWVRAIDLRDFWRYGNKCRKSARPEVGIQMRNNIYWLKDYRIESLEAQMPWPPVKPAPSGTGPLDFRPGPAAEGQPLDLFGLGPAAPADPTEGEGSTDLPR